MADAHAAELSPEEAHDVLERFVVDNDELLELEEQIGRFNIFDALGVARAEIRHSNFLSWLLDPNESHGQGALFLKAILMDLLKEAPPSLRPLSPVELDGEELRGVEVRREWKKIDLLITCKEPPFVIAVENKIDAGEHGGQLGRYKKIVHERFGELQPMFVFLTTGGSEPSDEDWVPYSYADIHRVLERVRRTGHGAIGDDVEAFLEHYLRLIGSRFMDDPKIDELCQRIYKNHRQAIELIVERIGSPRSLIIKQVDEMLQGSDWHIFNRTTQHIKFIPRDWLDFLPSWGRLPRRDPRSWFRCQLEIRKKSCYLFVVIGACHDTALRLHVIDRLIQNPKEFSFRVRQGKVTERYTRVYSQRIATWTSGELPEPEELLPKIKEAIHHLRHKLAPVPDALRPIIEEWEASR